MRLLVGLGLAMAVTGCGPDTVTLAVDLQTDLRPGVDFEGVTVELREGTDPSAPTVREAYREVDEPPAALERGVRVASFEDLEVGSHLLTVRLGGPRPRRRDVLVQVTSDLVVPVMIARACDDVVCPPPDDASLTECAGGVCIAPSCIDPTDPTCGADCTSCGDPDCEGVRCDDADACTYGDTCTSGSCRGVAIVCEGDACVSRTCDGTDTCATRPAAAGTSCDDDDNPCTRDECDGAGACAHPPAPAGVACPADDNECTSDGCDGRGACAHPALPDGTPWSGGEFAACCGGRETQLDTRANCGGCGVACPGTRACNEVAFPDFPAHPACECSTADPVCPGAQSCNGFLDFCFCTEDRHCPADQRCIRMPLPPSANTHNYCGY